jgi:hypothetical protein
MDGKYIDRPGVDLARVVKDGRMYPVTMTIPIGGGVDPDGRPLETPLPGFNIPTHDEIIITEDQEGKLITVVYKYQSVAVTTLDFTYS